MRHPRLLSLLALVCAAPAAAAAPALQQARAAYGELNYEGCRDKAQEALEEPATLDERVDAFRHLGLCQAALGEVEEAREAFVTMLAIDPGATLPDGLSPRFTSTYLEAKGHWMGKETLGLVLETDVIEGRTRTVRVQISDPLDLVTRVTWADDEGERAPALAAAERMELELPAEVAMSLLALDASGGVVASLRLPSQQPAAELAAEPATPPGAAEIDEGGGAPWLWVGVAAGGGVLLAGAIAAATAAMLMPPSAVDLQSEIVFGNQ